MNMHIMIKNLIAIQDILRENILTAEHINHLKQQYTKIIESLSSTLLREQRQLLHTILKSLITTHKPTENIFTLFGIEESDIQQKPMNTYEVKESKESQENNNEQMGISAFAELAYHFEKNGIAQHHAEKLYTMCGDLQNTLIYLHEFTLKNKTNEHIFHDACLFNLPNTSSFNISAWRTLANNNNKWKNLIENKDFKEYILPSASKIEETLIQKASLQQDDKYPFDLSNLKDAQKKSFEKYWNVFKQHPEKPHSFQLFLKNCPLSVLMDEYNKLLFQNAERNVQAALEFKKQGLTQAEFDTYLGLKSIDSEEIPNICITGTHIGVPNYHYYLKKLDPSNPKAACLGKITNCCQSLGGEGEECAIYGITSPHSGFYVICKGDAQNPKANDLIVSQSWAWRSKSGALVLDSIEYLNENAQGIFGNTRFKNIDIWEAFYKTLTNKLVENPDYGIHSVMVGTGGKTPEHLGLGVPIQEEPIDYNGYRDSTEQFILSSATMPLCELYYLSPAFPGGISVKEPSEKKVQEYIHHHPSLEDILQLILQDPSINMTKINFLYSLERLLPAELHFRYAMDILKIDIKNMNEFLCMLATFGSILIVEWLMSKDLHLSIEHLTHMIIVAVQNGKCEMVHYLQQKGGQLKEDISPSLLELAIMSNHLEMVQYIVNNTYIKDTKAIYNAANKSSLLIVQYLISKNIGNINYQNDKGETALFRAIYKKKWDILKYLIELGANVNIKDNTNSTVLTALLSSEEVDLDILKYLLSKCKKYLFSTAHDISERTALHIAACKGNLKAVQYLVENKVDLNKQDFRGYTALYQALINNHFDIVIYLSEQNGIELNIPIKTDENETPLFYAAMLKEWDVAKVLLKNGADGSSLLPLLQNRILHKPDIFYFLIQHTANPIKKEELSYQGFPLMV